MSALALLPRFPVAALDAAGLDSFVHRDYPAVFASVPVIAVGSIAAFLLKDRLTAGAVRGSSDTDSATSATPQSASGAVGDALGSRLAAGLAALRPDEELALAGVLLAVMAERLEHDPVAYPLLACAAARLVPERAVPAGRRDWTGLTERARRAAVDVLRPLALSTLVRAATWDVLREGGAA